MSARTVLHLVQQPQRRGAEIFAQQLSGALSRAGWSSRAVYLYDHVGETRLEPGPDDVVLGGDPQSPFERGLGLHPRLLASVLRQARQADVVVLHGARSVKYGVAARRLGGAPVVYRNIGNVNDWVRGRRRRAFYRCFVFAGLDGIACLSERSRRALLDDFGVRARVDVIPSAIDPTVLAPRRARDEVRAEHGSAGGVVLSVGSLSPEKRVDRVIEVLARLGGGTAWLVGGGPETHALRALAERLGVSRRVRFLGSRSDVGDLYHAADVLLLTSDTEGMPGVLLEAQWCRLPVVASAVGDVAACVDRDSAVLLEPQDVDGMTRSVAALLDDPTRRRSMGESGHRHVSERFVLDVVVGRWLALLEATARVARGA